MTTMPLALMKHRPRTGCWTLVLPPGARAGLIAIPLVFLGGCVTPNVVESPPHPIDFSRFKTVAYRIHPQPDTDYGPDTDHALFRLKLLNNDSPPVPSGGESEYAVETLKIFDTYLGQKLSSMGYASAPVGERPDLTIDVAVTSVRALHPGGPVNLIITSNQATLLFVATFRDSTGTTLASFKGGWIYTDAWEIWSYYMRDSEIPSGCSWRAVNQIAEFIRNGGSFPKGKERPAP